MFVWKEHDSPFDFKYLKFLFYATEHMKEHMLNSIQDTTDTTDTDGMTEIRQAFLTGERAEFFARKRRYVDTVFADGESPLKHACDIELVESSLHVFAFIIPVSPYGNNTYRDRKSVV